MPTAMVFSFFFFFNDTATTEIYTLSLQRRSSDLETDQAGALHGAIVLVPQRFELGELPVGSKTTRKHVKALEPLLMFLQELAKARREGELVGPVPREIDLHARLFIGGVEGTPVHGRSVQPSAIERHVQDSTHADDDESSSVRGNEQGIAATIG